MELVLVVVPNLPGSAPPFVRGKWLTPANPATKLHTIVVKWRGELFLGLVPIHKFACGVPYSLARAATYKF